MTLEQVRKELSRALGPLLRLEESLRKQSLLSEQGNVTWEADLWRDDDGENSMGLRPLGRASDVKEQWLCEASLASSNSKMVRQVTPHEDTGHTGEAASVFNLGKLHMSEASSRDWSRQGSRQITPLADEDESEIVGRVVRISDADAGQSPVSPAGSDALNSWTQLRVHEIWERETDSLRSRRFASNRSSGSHSSRSLHRLKRNQSAKVRMHGLEFSYVIKPDSMVCIAWDFACAGAMLHDSVMIPLLSAFDIATAGVVLGFALASAFVWLIDFFFSFFRGYIDFRTGFVEMRMSRIAYRYVTGWCLPDVALLSLDAVAFFSTDSMDVQSFTLLRLFRSLRLLRLVRMFGRAHLLKEHLMMLESIGAMASVYLETCLSIIKHITIIAFLCHFTGCAWYALGREEERAAGFSWITVHQGMRQDLGLPSDILYMYSTALHWSLTQFTPAAMEVSATNGIERTFNVFVVLTGLIVFSFFLGSINQALSHLRSRSAQDNHQNMLVRRYISDKQISVDLAADVFAYIRQRGLGRARSKVVLSDMQALDGLPRSLLMNIQLEVGLPVLETHAFLKHLSVLGNNEIPKLCEKALKEARRIYGEDLFHAGAAGEKMYFIQSGRLNYASEHTPDIIEEVSKGARCSEASIWLTWEHHGQMTCVDHSCHLFHLDGAGFRKILIKSERAELCTMYARLFLRKLIEEYVTEEDASDLFGSDKEVGEIMVPIRGMLRTSNLMRDMGEMSVGWVFYEWKEWLRELKQERKKSKKNPGLLHKFAKLCNRDKDF